jgi:hypothetical protein
MFHVLQNSRKFVKFYIFREIPGPNTPGVSEIPGPVVEHHPVDRGMVAAHGHAQLAHLVDRHRRVGVVVERPGGGGEHFPVTFPAGGVFAGGAWEIGKLTFFFEKIYLFNIVYF